MLSALPGFFRGLITGIALVFNNGRLPANEKEKGYE
jgi:hypothetical protein